MSTLRSLKKLIFGDTWIQPVGLGITLLAGGLLRALATQDRAHLGGFILLAGVLLVFVASVNRSAGGR
jgi:hypothetical protein